MSALQQEELTYFETVVKLFRQRRGGGFFALSRGDWELIDGWQRGGVPIDAVLQGIDRAFGRASVKGRQINTLGYCLRAIEETIKEHMATHCERREVPSPEYSHEDIRLYLEGLARGVEKAPIIGPTVVEQLAAIAELIRMLDPARSMVELDGELGLLEEQLVVSLRAATLARIAAQLAIEIREELKPISGSLTATQFDRLEVQLWRRKVLEHYKVPRLSLFYLDINP